MLTTGGSDAPASPVVPRIQVPVFEVRYSDQTLTVTCQVQPEDPSSACVSLLLVQAKNSETGTVYCSAQSRVDPKALPAAGAGLTVNSSTRLFNPVSDGSAVSITCFGFITDTEGRSFAFDGMKKLDLAPEGGPQPQSEKRHSK